MDHAALSDANRSTYLRVLGSSEFFTVALSADRSVADDHPPHFPFTADVQRGATASARLSAEQSRLCNQELTVSGQRARTRTNLVARDVAHHFDRNFSAAGGST